MNEFNRINLCVGAVELIIPRHVYIDEVSEIEEWFALIVRRLRRNAIAIPPQETRNALDPQGRQPQDEEGKKPEG